MAKTILEHWRDQRQLCKCRTDNKILEEIMIKVSMLTPSERDHLDNELSLIWLREDYKPPKEKEKE